MASTTKPVEKKIDGPLVIHAGRSSQGFAYGLHPLTRLRIKEAYPEAKPAPRLFIGFDTKQELEQALGPIWNQMAVILTGLTPRQMSKIGGVRIFEPRTERVLHEWDPAAITSQ